jgi:Protein of unknown function (DUF3800)
VLDSFGGALDYMHLAYLDDSGTDGQSGITLCGAVIVDPQYFMGLENLHGAAVQLLPKEAVDNFQEFKASELFSGQGPFKPVEKEKRFEAIRVLLTALKVEELPYIYFAVDDGELSKNPMGSAKPFDMAFRMCLLGIEEWARSMHPQRHGSITLDFKDFFLCVMDDTTDNGLKHQLRASYRLLRSKRPYGGPAYHRLWHAHDDLYFGDSKESVGLQMVDLCNYFVWRHLCGREDEVGFYQMIAKQIICAKSEPEWSHVKSMAKVHTVPDKADADASAK